jgi:hypothetical protein
MCIKFDRIIVHYHTWRASHGFPGTKRRSNRITHIASKLEHAHSRKRPAGEGGAKLSAGRPRGDGDSPADRHSNVLSRMFCPRPPGDGPSPVAGVASAL